jgi:hypothetical protein
MGSSVVGRTEEERELLRVEGGSDVGGDDRLRVDAREEEEMEDTIDDSRENDGDGGGVASLCSDKRARFERRPLCC